MTAPQIIVPDRFKAAVDPTTPQDQISVPDRFKAQAPTPTPEPQQQQGFLSYLQNLAVGGFKAAAIDFGAGPGSLNAMIQDPNADPEMKKIAIGLGQAKQTGSGFDIAWNDFKNIIPNMFSNVSSTLSSIAAAPGGIVAAVKNDPIGFGGQVAKGFISPIGDAYELGLGLHLTDPNTQFQPLTPEEKAQRIKGTAATIAMVATGAGLAEGLAAGVPELRAGMAAADAASGAASTVDLASGGMAGKLLKNAAIAGASGGVFGMVSHANEKDQLAETIIQGVTFATLGAAHELVFGGAEPTVKATPKTETQAAGQVAQVRQLQFDLQQTTQGMLQSISALASSDTPAEALLTSKLNTEGQSLIDIPGVSQSEMSRLANKVPDGHTVVRHADGDDSSMLVIDDEAHAPIDESIITPADQKKIESLGRIANGVNVNRDLMEAARDQIDAIHDTYRSDAVQFYKKTGLVQGQQVSWGGSTDWTVTGGDNDFVTLKSTRESGIGVKQSGGLDQVKVARDDIRKPGNVQVDLSIFDPAITPSKTNALYDEWKSGLATKPKNPLDDLNDQAFDLAEQIRDAPDDQVEALKTQQDALDVQIDALKKAQNDPSGFDAFDDPEGVNRMPDPVDFHAGMVKFLTDKGHTPVEINTLSRKFESKLFSDASTSFDEDTQKLLEEAHAQISEQNASLPIDAHAGTNQMSATVNGPGDVVVKDTPSKKLLLRTTNPDRAKTFIDKSGQASGPDLIGGIGAGGRRLPPPGAVPPADLGPYSWFDKFKGFASSSDALRHTLSASMSWGTPSRNYAVAIDNIYGTDMMNRVWNPLQDAMRMVNAKATPHIDVLAGIQKSLKNIDLRQVGEWINTRTPDEIRKGFYPNRPLSAVEDAMGTQLGASQIDFENLGKYRMAVQGLREDFGPLSKLDPDQRVAYQKEMTAAQQAFNIDDAHRGVADVFDQVTDLGKPDISIAAITKLAQTIQAENTGGGLSRTAYAAKNKLSLQQINAGIKLDALHARVSEQTGINSNLLQSILDHARVSKGGNVVAALDDFSFKDADTRAAYEKVLKTRELNPYEQNPIAQAQRVVMGNFKAQHLTDAVSGARASLKEGLKQITETAPGAAQHTGEVINRYINAIQGNPAASDRAMQSAVDYYGDTFGVESPSVRKTIVGALTTIIPSATQGFVPVQGLRDLAQGITSYAARFGPTSTGRMLTRGAEAVMGDGAKELQTLGIINRSTILNVQDLAEAAGSRLKTAGGKISQAFDATTQTAFKGSMQPTIYDIMQSGIYLETRDRASAQLLKLSRGETTWPQVEKSLKLKQYEMPVQQEFKSLAQQGMKSSMDDAVRYLGIQTIHETTVVHGLANQPDMWGNNWGRVLGQYGQWPVAFTHQVLGLATKGTISQRAASVATLVAVNQGMIAAGNKLGMDLNNWSILRGLAFAGGPLVTVYNDAKEAINGYGEEQQLSQRRMRRLLPIDPATGQMQKSIFVPGSYAIDNLAKAATQFQQGNPVGAGATAVGFRPLPPHL